MKLSLKLLIVCGTLSLSVLAQQPEYKLVFVDDFNGQNLNESVWNIEVNGNGGGNGEYQYYRRENVSIGKAPTGENCLILTAKKENFGGKQCTSGRVNTKNKMFFRYGMIEARINIPFTKNGLWPAFWMMGNNYDQVGWPRCGEIDIFEMGHRNGIAAGTQDRYYSGWWHWGETWNNYPNTGMERTETYPIQGTFVTFRLYWDQYGMKMYLDQDKNPRIEPYATHGMNAGYFDKPFFVLLNLAIGGHFPDVAGMNGVTAFANTPGGEPKMYIDYVKVYQKNDPTETFNGNKNGDGSQIVGGGTYPPLPPPVVSVTGVTLNKTVTTLAVGANETLRVTLQPSNVNNRKVTWSSSNKDVVAVTSTGYILAKAVGTATITVTTEDGNKTASCVVTVGSGSPPPQPGTNLALNKPIQSSDDVNDLGKATAAVDGNDGTRWESKQGEDNKNLTIDLQNIYRLNEVVINWEGAFAKQFDVQVSTNGTNWTTAQSNVTGKVGEQEIAINNMNARYVRIVCKTRETIYGFSIWEVEVYGTATTGELSVNTTQGVSILPNPVEDVLYIQSETVISGIILSDVNGRKLFESNDANNIDMSAYSTGMYLLIIKTAEGETVVKKIIKK